MTCSNARDRRLRGGIYYCYPGTNAGPTIPFSPASNIAPNFKVASGRVDNTELYIGGSWKFLSLKYYHSVNEYFVSKTF